jgi:hypothetical protein
VLPKPVALANYADVSNETIPAKYGRYNLDWTAGGLAGKDIKD